MLNASKSWTRVLVTAAPVLVWVGLGTAPARAQSTDASAVDAASLPSNPVPSSPSGQTEPAYGSSNAYGSAPTDVDDRGGSGGAGIVAGAQDISGGFFGGLPIPPLGYTLRGSLHTQHESNFRRIPSGTPTLPGQHKSDVRFTPLVNATVNMPLGRQSFFVTGLFGKDYYLHNTSYDRGRYAASAGLNLAAGTLCQGLVSGNYLSQQSSSSSSLVNLPNKQITKSAGASASCGTQSGLAASFNYRHSNASNSLLSRQRLDLDNDNFTLTLGVGNQRLGMLALIGSKSYNRYPNQPPNPDGSERGSNIGNLGFSYKRTLGRNIQIDGHLTRVHVSPSDPSVQASNSLGYGLSVAYVPPTRYSLTVDMSRNASASPNVNALYFIQQSLGATLNYQLRPSLGVEVSAHSSKRQYQGGTPALGVTAEDKLNQYRMQINWQSPGGRIGSNLFLMQQNRSGDRLGSAGIIDYTNFIAGITVSVGI